jgi:predicted short-subunit dehydrogenase-like oxidoreductase (DUF2520 family)
MSFTLSGAQSMMLGLSGQVARRISKVLSVFDALNIRGSRQRVNKTGTEVDVLISSLRNSPVLGVSLRFTAVTSIFNAEAQSTAELRRGHDRKRMTAVKNTAVNKLKPAVSIIGTGRLGTALAIALAQEGYSIGALVARRRKSAKRAAAALDGPTRVMAVKELADLAAPGLLIIATPDDQIAKLAETLAKLDWDIDRSATVLHTSGALSASVLSPLREKNWSAGSLHPLVSVSEPKAGARLLRGAFWSVEGDKRAVRLGRSIVRDLDGKSFSISSDNKPLYHAAAVMASGNVTALFDVAIGMLAECGLTRRQAQTALLPLLASAVRNLEELDPARALTGTFTRGDVETVKRHLASLKNHQPALEAYRLLGRRSLQLASSRLDPAVVKRIKRLIR